MSSAEQGTAHIIQSLVANLAIALGKGVAAWFTHSGAMLAETLHSFADCGNQLLLLLGVHRARRPPTAQHPLGYGMEVYFWSFIVALLLFSGGGLFSIYEGVHKLKAPEPVHQLGLGLGMLVFSLALEGWSLYGNVLELNRRRKKTSFFRFLQDTKDSDLIVVFAENAAAVVGLIFAMIALGLSFETGDGRWDAVGSLAIGLVLVAVAIFLATEVKSLLVGEAAEPDIDDAVAAAAGADPRILEAFGIITIQQGPGEVLVALKINVQPDLTAGVVCDLINAFELRLRSIRPEVRWLFVEPDRPERG